MRSVQIGVAAALFLLASTVPALGGAIANAPVLDKAGKKVQVSSLVGSGTAFVVFYRGHW